MAGLTYRDAGVDIDAGERLVDRIKPLAKSTQSSEVLSGIGGFAGLFKVPQDLKDPVLVSGTDGVGTKLKLAFELDRHDTIGIDLVAMCVNDIITTGARPLFFLDYFGTSNLNVEQATDVVRGIAEGCRQAGCALLGGETAELPGFYARGEYDLAGFAVGIAEREALIDGSKVKEGDVIIGVASSGVHSNGYSLVRSVLEQAASSYSLKSELGSEKRSLGEILLEPTKIYVDAVASARALCDVHAIAHITGGGLPGNIPRVIPEHLAVKVDANSWKRPAIFEWLQSIGKVEAREMYRTFNMGIGLALIIEETAQQDVLQALKQGGHSAWAIGSVSKNEGERFIIEGE